MSTPDNRPRPIRVLIVEDHPVVAEGLASLLEDYPEITITGVAFSVAEVISAVENATADIAVIDYHLPDGTAYDAIERIRSRWPSTAVVLISADDGNEPLLAAVEARCAVWPARSLHVERFAARPLTAPVRAEAFEVELAASELTLTIPPDRSILDMVEEAGIGVLSSCAEGTCGTCETAVLSGVPDHRDSVLTEEERQARDCMMICVSRSCTERLVLDL